MALSSAHQHITTDVQSEIHLESLTDAFVTVRLSTSRCNLLHMCKGMLTAADSCRMRPQCGLSCYRPFLPLSGFFGPFCSLWRGAGLGMKPAWPSSRATVFDGCAPTPNQYLHGAHVSPVGAPACHAVPTAAGAGQHLTRSALTARCLLPSFPGMGS